MLDCILTYVLHDVVILTLRDEIAQIEGVTEKLEVMMMYQYVVSALSLVSARCTVSL